MPNGQLNCVNEYTIKIKINAWEKTKNKRYINQSSQGTEITMYSPNKRHQKTEVSFREMLNIENPVKPASCSM